MERTESDNSHTKNYVTCSFESATSRNNTLIGAGTQVCVAELNMDSSLTVEGGLLQHDFSNGSNVWLTL